MEVTIILLVFSLLLAGGFLVTFLISLKRGQFDDLSTPSYRMLFDNQHEKNNE